MNSIDAEIEEFLMAKENYAFAKRVYEMYPQAINTRVHKFMNQLEQAVHALWTQDTPLQVNEVDDKGRIGREFSVDSSSQAYLYCNWWHRGDMASAEGYYGIYFDDMTVLKENEEAIKDILGTKIQDAGLGMFKIEDMLHQPKDTAEEISTSVVPKMLKLQKIFAS